MPRQIPGNTSRGLIRSRDRRGARSDMSPPVAQKERPPEDPSVCDVCGSVYTAKTWRRNRPLPAKLVDAAAWTVCPACKQTKSGKYFGRVLVRGATRWQTWTRSARESSTLNGVLSSLNRSGELSPARVTA